MSSDRAMAATRSATFVLWTSAAVVSIAGLLYPPSPPASPHSEPTPVQAAFLKVTLQAAPAEPGQQPAGAEQQPAAAAVPLPPQAPATASPPGPQQMTPLANAPVFAEPVAPRAAEIAATQATASATAAETAAAAPVRRLTYGAGEGAQPAPEYPREAVLGREEGTVLLRFEVDPSGNVHDVQVAGPCPWPLLNQAAARAVRETWRFRSGPARLYEIAIDFQLRRD